MKMGPDALGTAENMSGSQKHGKGTRRPRYRQKRVRTRKTRKWDPRPPVSPKTSPRAQNVKTRPDAVGTAENEYGSAKRENKTRRPRYRRKRVRDCKTCPRAGYGSGKHENEYGSGKHENGMGRPRYRGKRVRARKIRKRDPMPPLPPKMSPGEQNKRTGPDGPGTAGNESGSAKRENGTRRPRYHQKRVRERKT
jgi:hypothetical protein